MAEDMHHHKTYKRILPTCRILRLVLTTKYASVQLSSYGFYALSQTRS